MATSGPTTSTTRTAAHRRLGVLAVAFMIIAASAPLTVVAGGVTSAYSVTHVDGIPFGYIVLAAALAIFAIGYAAMSRFITNAGAFYSYVSQGIGRPTGVGASVLALIAYNAMQIGIWGMFGFQISSFIESKTGWASPWWVWVILGIVVVGILGVNRVDLSAKVLGVLVALEFLAVIVFDVVAFVNPAEGFTVAPMTPSALFVPGVGAVLAFGIIPAIAWSFVFCLSSVPVLARMRSGRDCRMPPRRHRWPPRALSRCPLPCRDAPASSNCSMHV